jgi:hypothetical protein
VRLSLSYFDQNEEFGALLPRNGTVERFVRSSTGSDWALFNLDSQLIYRDKSYNWLLLESRWRGCSIGDSEPTSVFVVLVQDMIVVRDGMTISRSDSVAWGMAETIA